jgi:hypothetical protein
MNRAIDLCADEFNVTINEFTVAGINYENLFAHHWYVGTNKPVDAQAFRNCLDNHLKNLNDDYRVERSAALKEVIVEVLPIDVFYAWMEKNGKIGGQSKFPRVIKDERLESWKQHLKSYQNV